MRPPNGPYRLTYKPGMAMDVVIDDDGMHTPYGLLPYVPPPPPGDLFRRLVPPEPRFGVDFPDDEPGHYRALLGADEYGGTYTSLLP